LNPDALANTVWIVERAINDLSANSFTEIYRYNGPTHTETSALGISSKFVPAGSPTSVIVSDGATVAPRAFYRCRVEYVAPES
jgi:hypothetical protein